MNYYPVLILDDQRKMLINKQFNSMVDQDLKKGRLSPISNKAKRTANDYSGCPFEWLLYS